MANRPQVTIEFKPKGDKALVAAINKLAQSMDKAEKAADKLKKNSEKLSPVQKSLKKQVDGVSKGLTKLSVNSKKGANALMDVGRKGAFATNHLRLAGGASDGLRLSFATLRSQLLLVSFGFTLVSGSVLKVVKLFGEQELAERRLTIALGHRSDALINQASALQQVTRFGDEAIIGAQAMLAVFVKDEAQLKRATQATLDLAAAKGMDLNTAADLVGKSIGSSTNALSRYGVEATGAVGTSERFESIVGNLSSTFGGFAQGELETTLGKLDSMNNVVGDAAENIGGFLAPAVEVVASNFKSLALALNPSRVELYGTSILMVAGAFVSMRAATALASAELAKFKAATIKSGIAVLAVVLAEVAYAMGAFRDETEFANREMGDFDAFLVGIGLTSLPNITEAEENFTEAIKANSEELSRSEEEIQKSVDALQRKLDILELNADATSAVDHVTKMLIENNNTATEQEFLLMQRIAEVTSARAREVESIKELEEEQRKLQAVKDMAISTEIQIQKIAIKMQTTNQAEISLANARADALSKLLKLSSDEVNIQRILNDEFGEGNLVTSAMNGSLIELAGSLAMSNNEAQIQVNLILALLAAQEEYIKSIDKTAEVKIASDLAVKNSSTGLMMSMTKIFEAQGKITEFDKAQMDIDARKNQLANETLALEQLKAAGKIQGNELQIRENELRTKGNEIIADEIELSNQLSATEKANQEIKKQGMLQAADIAIQSASKINDAMTKDGKKRAKIQFALSVMSAIKGGIQTWENLTEAKVPFPIPEIIGAAQTAAQIVQANKIKEEAGKFQYGGLVGGNLHSQGGTMIEAERGEYVMSRDAVESIGVGNLDAMNKGRGGGVTVHISGNVMTEDFVENDLAEKIREAVRKGVDFGIDLEDHRHFWGGLGKGKAI